MACDVHLKHKIVTIKKAHQCLTCGEILPTGKKMMYHVGIYEGDFNSYYMCPCCEAYSDFKGYEEYGAGEFSSREYVDFKQKFYAK